MKITDFRDIKTFPHCGYHVHVDWSYLEKHIAQSMEFGLDLNPDFQREHVWNESQQSKYCEYVLQGGTSGKELYFNCPGWSGTEIEGPYVIVDGKQRLEAVRSFMRGEIKVFGAYRHEYTNKPDMMVARFSWNVAALKTRKEVLEWYLNFNSGGVVHTEEELDRVRALLDMEVGE